jgi:hypothetical protein
LYKQQEIAEIIWITGDSNPADSITKQASNAALEYIVNTNKIDIQAAA